MKFEIPVYQMILNYLYHNSLRKRREVNMSQISRDLGITYSHIHAVVELLSNTSFVKTKKKGRCVYVSLTRKGKNISMRLYIVSVILRKELKSYEF